MRTKLVFLFVAILCVSSFAQTAWHYNVPYSEVYPKMDGNLADDPAWEKIPWSQESFKVFRTNTEAAVSTRFKALYTVDAIYLAFECMDPEMSKMKPENNPAEIWIYDILEIFVFPKKEELMHFAVSAGGLTSQEIPGAVSKRTKFRTAWQGVSRKYGDRWASEVCLPFFLLGVVPDVQKETKLAFTVSRYAPLRTQYSTWTPQNNLKSTESYGNLVLQKAPVERQSAIEAARDTPHWISLVERWDNIRKDKSWRTILETNKEVVAEIDKLYADSENYAKNCSEFAKKLAEIEKYADQKVAAERVKFMRRFFEE